MSFDAPEQPRSGPDPEPGALPARVPRTLGGPPVEGTPRVGDAGGPSPRRRPGAALLVVVAVAAAAAAALLVSGPLGGGGGPLNPIAEAAEKTLAWPGARIEIRASMDGLPGGASIAMRGEGVFNGHSERARVSLAVSARGVSGLSGTSFAMIVDGPDLYLSSGLLPAQLTGGRRWLLIRDAGDSGAGGLDQGDPRDQLGQLRSVGGAVTLVGRERLGGVPVDHYAARIELEREVERLRAAGSDEQADALESSIELLGTAFEDVDVWIDGRGLVRRMHVSLPFAMLGQGGRMALTMDLSDFGIDPPIALPPEGQIYDATGEIDGALGSLAS